MMTLDDIQKAIDVLEEAHSVVLAEYWPEYDLVIQLSLQIEYFKTLEKRIGAAAIEQVISANSVPTILEPADPAK